MDLILISGLRSCGDKPLAADDDVHSADVRGWFYLNQLKKLLT
jgi:hypothetical protein